MLQRLFFPHGAEVILVAPCNTHDRLTIPGIEDIGCETAICLENNKSIVLILRLHPVDRPANAGAQSDRDRREYHFSHKPSILDLDSRLPAGRPQMIYQFERIAISVTAGTDITGRNPDDSLREKRFSCSSYNWVSWKLAPDR